MSYPQRPLLLYLSQVSVCSKHIKPSRFQKHGCPFLTCDVDAKTSIFVDSINNLCACDRRQMLFCRVTLGKSFLQFSAMKMAHAPPGHHSVIGRPSVNGLAYAEYVIYRGEQVSA